jgi:hypothetical protein
MRIVFRRKQLYLSEFEPLWGQVFSLVVQTGSGACPASGTHSFPGGKEAGL